jgi:hypothetical protein
MRVYLLLTSLWCPIGAAQETWRSPAYKHYIVEVYREYNHAHDPPTLNEIFFCFSCKYHDPDHPPHYRGRTKTGGGTTFLLEKAKSCDARRSSLSLLSASDSETKPDIPSYSDAKHRAILALWSANSHRSFESLTDKFHRMEVDFLRPGTKLPSPETISRDVKAVHLKLAPKCCDPTNNQ